VGLLLESYAVWPVISTLPQLRPDASDSFESALARMMLLMLMLAAPVLVVLFVADLALGLINRYAPGLNLLTIAPALKSLLAVLLLMMMLGSMIDLLVNEFTVRNLGILRLIDSLFSR
jgi:type III secretion protein T